jgi:pimeloyl-ACP methyl ester carboxylesterase
MSNFPDVLWLNVSPALKPLDCPLLSELAQVKAVACWEYQLGEDEPSSLEEALVLLHDYLKLCPHPVHLVAHGTAGLVGLKYACCHPARVQSLALLSVGASPSIDWKAHYYTRLQALLCSRSFALSQMVRELFGRQSPSTAATLQSLLEKDLGQSLSLHSLYQVIGIPPTECPVPLLVVGARDDSIVPPHILQEWLPWLKPSDRLWECPGGRYFFHHFYPQLVRDELMPFWDGVDAGIRLLFPAEQLSPAPS